MSTGTSIYAFSTNEGVIRPGFMYGSVLGWMVALIVLLWMYATSMNSQMYIIFQSVLPNFKYVCIAHMLFDYVYKVLDILYS